MAISPPSDLVLDVVRAADPADVQAAQTRLKANQAAFRATSLAETGNGFGAAVGTLNRFDGSAAVDSAVKGVSSAKGTAETYRKFESVILQNFVKSMLPSESEEVYGEGTAGEMWRGMMAEQIGDVISKAGGIGIASMLMKNQLDASASNQMKASLDGTDLNLSRSLVQEFQRTTFSDMKSADEAEDKA